MLPAGEGVTHDEAAEILGCTPSTVQRLIAVVCYSGTARTDIGGSTDGRWRSLRPVDASPPGRGSKVAVGVLGDEYEAAELMGISRARVGQLAAEGRLPHVVCEW